MKSKVGSISKGKTPDFAYEMLASFPIMWRRKAAELNRMVWAGYKLSREDFDIVAADNDNILEIPPSTLFVSFFLAALATENLLKGILVFAHPEFVKNGRLIGKYMTSHKLAEIAHSGGVTLTKDEADFCELGSEAIMNFGRYHIGKCSRSSPSAVVVDSKIFDVYGAFYKKLWNQIEQNKLPPKRTP